MPPPWSVVPTMTVYKRRYNSPQTMPRWSAHTAAAVRNPDDRPTGTPQTMGNFRDWFADRILSSPSHPALCSTLRPALCSTLRASFLLPSQTCSKFTLWREHTRKLCAFVSYHHSLNAGAQAQALHGLRGVLCRPPCLSSLPAASGQLIPLLKRLYII